MTTETRTEYRQRAVELLHEADSIMRRHQGDPGAINWHQIVAMLQVADLSLRLAA